MKRFLKREDGQAMVIMAFALVAIMGFGAFGIDLGRVAVQQSSLQNIADAAALAGAQDLPTATTSIATAITYADTNGLKGVENGIAKNGDTITVTTPYAGDVKEIEVVCKRTVDYTFARVLGLNSKDVTARAVVRVTNAGGAAFGYALFAGAGTVTLGGSSHVVGGSIYGRDGVNLGNQATVNGDVVCTASGTIVAGNGSVVNGASISNSPAIPMPDFSDLVKQEGIVCNGQNDFNAVVTGKTVDGPIYVNGNITVNGRIQGSGVIYASGTITFANDTILQTASDHILFYAATGDMTFNGGNGVNVGILYAPNGTITVNGSPNSVTYGRLIAKYISFNGSKGSVYAQSGDLNSLSTLSQTKLVK